MVILAVMALLVGTPVDSVLDGRTDMGGWHYGHMFGFAGDPGQWCAGHMVAGSQPGSLTYPMTRSGYTG